MKFIVDCLVVVQLGGPVFRWYLRGVFNIIMKAMKNENEIISLATYIQLI